MIARFFASYPGMYITQSVLHSFVAVFIVELSFFAWQIRGHQEKFRYRVLTLTLPPFMFPLFQLFSPDRGSWHFRLVTALFDSQRWIEMTVLNVIPLAAIFLLALLGITVIFLIQEILPIYRERSLDGTLARACDDETSLALLMDEVCALTGIARPTVCVIDEPLPILVTQGFREHTIIVSRNLINTLGREELKGALTHEAVHIMRDSNVKTQLIYLFRMLMFYNPVSMVEFRRVVHDDEFICDAITVARTGNVEALITALAAFFCRRHDDQAEISHIKERIELHSHNLLLEERIRRLRELAETGPDRFRWVPFLMTAAAILVIGYLVV